MIYDLGFKNQKSEYQSTKSETNTNYKNTNDKNV